MIDLQPPSRFGLFREPFGILEIPRLLWYAPGLAEQPKGDGEPVMVFPGYGASDASTTVLRAYLSYIGYAVNGWGLGTNMGDVRSLLPQVLERLAALTEEEGRPVRLVGWSLGGYLAREAARERPQDVECVVTLGSPVIGGPKYTTVAARYRRRGFDLDAIETAIAERKRVALKVPVTAIYSKNDGIVAWRACIDEEAGVTHEEVGATHIGLGFSPEVYVIVARALAGLQPE